MFDNGRLKQATYDTAQGFGLRAVKDEAVGYAHASDVSEAAHRARRRCGPRGQGRLFRPLCRTAGAHQRASSTATTTRSARPAFEAKVRLLENIDAYARAKDPRVRQVSVSLGATWQVVEILRADGETYRDIRPLVRVNVSVVVGDGDRQEAGSYGYGGREGYRALHRRRYLAATRSTRPCARRWSISKRCRRRPARWTSCSAPGWPGVMLHEAVGHGLEGDFNRKKTSAFAGLMGQQVAAKGVTVVDDGTIAAAPRLALDRRRGHADQPHRADRGRHPRRLHAGSAERAADGHEADRQRPARELRPRADAAHDQHLHARRHARARRDHRLGEERHLRRQFRRRPGRHHLRQVRVPMHRGLHASRTASSARRSRARC